MTEYIERENAVEELEKIPAYFDSGDIRYGIEISIDQVKKLPAADVVEVVRCKDCKHCEHINDEFDKNWWQCKRRGNSFQRKPNDFCSYGELKECER